MSTPSAVFRPAPVEPTHTWLITLQTIVGRGLSTATMTGSYTAKPGTTREAAYQGVRKWVSENRPEMADGTVLFFSIEPYRL